MKIAITALLTFFFNVFLINNTTFDTKALVKISPKSSIVIKGKSNVNTFTCAYDATFLNINLPIKYTQKNNTIKPQGAKIILQNKGFTCGSKMMTKDFIKLLKTNEFPTIEIEIIEISTLASKTSAKATITLAGKQNTYQIPINTNSNSTVFNGILPLNIKDFSIEPPTKMLGMVVVHEKVDIHFSLQLEIVD